MKKLLTFGAAVLVGVSAVADPITPARAMQIAQEYLVPGHAMTLQTEARMRRVAGVAVPTAPYYVISRGENQGYVIVAGDDCLPEILGYTEQGSFDEANVPEGLQDMLDVWTDIVERAQADGTNVAMAKERKEQQRRAAAERVDIAPFVTSHWHQSSPYNDNCPTLTNGGGRAATGCVATAASQILYYWRRDLPSTLQATTPTYGYGDAPVKRSVPKGTPLRWDLMLDQYGSESSEYKQEVAEFVFATGAATWLTYGSSTSGNIEKIPYTFATYFGMNGGTVHYRSDYGQEGWVQLLYKELAEGRPVMYTGVKGENDGHAVFVHGYKAKNDLFYFNFGWGAGNGYDGYYTVTTADGMNGFNNYQSALIGAYPKSWNMTAEIVPPAHVYANVENEFTVRIENNSTLDFRGVYLFAATSNTKPSKLSNAKSSDTETVFATGETAEITLTAKPTSDRDWNIYVTDANLNVLAKVTVLPEVATPDLHFESLSVDGSLDAEKFGGKDYRVVYNTKSTAYATLANASDIGYEGTLRMYFYAYDTDKKDWTEVGYKTGKIAVDGRSSATAEFNIASTSSCPFEVGKYYMGRLANPVPSSEDVIDYGSATDTVVRFVLKENDMKVVSFDDETLVLQGHFDNTAFNTSTFANKTAYKTATVYDLTQCTNVNEVSQTVNPNALIYVADGSKAAGVNVVCEGKCANLSLVPGHDFTPRADFVAEKAQITLGAEAAQWYLLTTPFAATVPDGIIVREITEHGITGISNGIKDVKRTEAGKTYLVMSSASRNVVLTGENVTVVAAPVENADAAVVGTYLNTVTPAGSQLVENSDKPSFVPVGEGTEVEALRGYWNASDLTKSFRVYPSLLLDPAYLLLAQNIEGAYQQLDKYSATSLRSAYSAYLSEIQAAEHEFSHRGEGETTLTTATLVKNYAAQLLEDGVAYMKQIARLGNREIDFTSCIVNPSFETNSTKGWTVGKKEGYSSVGSVYNGTTANSNRAVGLDGTYVFQSLIAKADSSSVGISQVVEGLTPGYYRLTAMLGTDENSSVTLFANDMTATVNGHEFGHLYLTKATIEDILVEANEGAETGVLTIGVKEGRWYKADDFTLTYVKTIKDIEEPDVIAEVAAEVLPSVPGIYTLQGVKVSQPTRPGVYIVNGKKLLYQ